MSDITAQHQAMFKSLADLSRKAAIHHARREEAIAASGGYVCPHCGRLLDRICWHNLKWRCSSCQCTFTET